MLLKAPKNIAAKILHQHTGSQDRPYSPRFLAPVRDHPLSSGIPPADPSHSTQSKADIDSSLDFETPNIINISPAASVESVVLKSTTTQQQSSPPRPHLADPPPRTSSRRKPPAPIRIPNGRIHGPAILVERDIDPADLENRISTSMKVPKVPRKSTRRKTRDGPKTEQPAAGKQMGLATESIGEPDAAAKVAESTRSVASSRRVSRAISVATTNTNDDAMTEASNDEYRFSLGFLMQPERMSVMTTRTGRADSATLPELSPFFASDSYIPPVPEIPASLRGVGAGVILNNHRDNTNEESHKKAITVPIRPLKPLQKANPRRSPIPPPGASPLASAYSQLAANSRPYVPAPTDLTRSVLPPRHPSGISDGSADYSPAFTAASPLDSPERNAIKLLRQDLFSADLEPGRPPAANIISDAKHKQRKKEPIEDEAPKMVMDISSSPSYLTGAMKSPPTSSASSVATPELSPSPPDHRMVVGASSSPASQEPSSTPESGSSLSQYEDSISNFEMITRPPPDDKREPSPKPPVPSDHQQQQRHRAPLPMSAVPMSAVPASAVSPSLSSASLDQYFDMVTFGSKLRNGPLRSPAFTMKPSEQPTRNIMQVINESPVVSKVQKEKDSSPLESTFAPNHLPAAASSSVLKKDVKESKREESNKLKFPTAKSPAVPEPVLAMLRERRNSLPSPISSASPNTFKYVSPLTGGPTTILFTPSSHQPLHAALSGYSSSGFGSFSLMSSATAKEKLRAVDDAGFRVSNLSIKTDHT
ncbi:hypothetical protein FRC17_002719, partial [Serendipita sp. 399]